MSDLVLRHDQGSITMLSLNRPERLNALDHDMFVALRRHLDTIAVDEQVRCVVVTGEGRSFCAGHDFGAISVGPSDPTFEAETIDALERLPQATIAAIQGHCLTGGLELALGCDFLIADDGAQFGDTHARFGLVPVWGMSVRLPERVGMQRARRMMLSGRLIGAADALAAGLVDEIVSAEQLSAAVQGLAEEVCSNSAGSIRIIKSLLRDSLGKSRGDALAHERRIPYGLAPDVGERLSKRA